MIYEVRSLQADRTDVGAYRPLTMPVLLLYGQNSPRSVARVVQLLHQHLSESRLQALPEAGHMGPLTDAELFLQEVEQHLASVKLKGA